MSRPKKFSVVIDGKLKNITWNMVEHLYPQAKVRKCIRCEKDMLSLSFGQRRCDVCKYRVKQSDYLDDINWYKFN